MANRYQLMDDTSNLDEVGLDTYPDPIVFFQKMELFNQSEPPLQYEVNQMFLQRPYLITNALYGKPYYEDIVMMLNDVPYITTIKEGDTLYFPVSGDLNSFLTKYGAIGVL